MRPADPYDLALADADFAPWPGNPRRSILICSHPRSGSTLLGEAVHFAGGLGCPLEYLHRGFRPTLAERWNAPELDAYVATLHRLRTDPGGTFSTKIFWQDVEEIAHEHAPGDFAAPGSVHPDDMPAEAYRALHALLGALLPNPEFVYLERQDRVRQAVSAVVAAQTGLWRSIPGIGRQQAVDVAAYDYDRILGMVALAEYSHGHWRNYFAANGVTPRYLSYEALVQDYDRSVTALLTALEADNPVPAPRRMRRQSDGASEAMVRQFLRDHAARAA